MPDTITIDRAGRLALPQSIRDRFNLTGGSELEIRTVGEHVEFAPLSVENEPDLVTIVSLSTKKMMTTLNSAESPGVRGGGTYDALHIRLLPEKWGQREFTL